MGRRGDTAIFFRPIAASYFVGVPHERVHTKWNENLSAD